MVRQQPVVAYRVHPGKHGDLPAILYSKTEISRSARLFVTETRKLTDCKKKVCDSFSQTVAILYSKPFQQGFHTVLVHCNVFDW